MESKKNQEKEPTKRSSKAQNGPTPAEPSKKREKEVSSQNKEPQIETSKANKAGQEILQTNNFSQLPSGMAPMAGQRGFVETSKFSKATDQTIVSNQPDRKTRPFDGKPGDVQSMGILKNSKQQASDLETEMSLLLGQSASKNQIKIQDEVTNNWRKKKERIQIYQLQKRFSVQEIKQEWVKNLINWKKGDQKGDKKTLYLKQVTSKNDLILHVTDQSRMEMLDNYEDRWPLLNFRKSLQRMRIQINQIAYTVLKHKAFENACLLVIGVNCYVLAVDDPTAEFQKESDIRFDKAFLALYSVEMIIKIVALGFLFNKGAYLRDPWNVLDFVIVGSAWLTEIQNMIGGSSNNSLGALRAFRVLRPLKAVTSIKGLQVLVIAVLKSIPLLKDTFMILIFFFLIFAIAGLQLFAGMTKQTCLYIDTGKINMEFYLDQANQGFCGGANYCPENNFCGQIMANADYGTTNFDNILWGLLQVFISITLEGWSEFMVKYQKTYTWLVGPLFFIPMSYLGGFFLLNLLLAVINSSFSSSNAVLQAKLKAELEKSKTRKKPVKDDDWKDPTDGEPIMEIGTSEYFVAKRVAKRMIERLRSIQAEKAAQAAYLKDHPPVFEEEEDNLADQTKVAQDKSGLINDKTAALSPTKQRSVSPQQQNEQEIKDPVKTLISDDILDDSDESEDHAKQVTDFLAQLELEEKQEREAKQNRKIRIVTEQPNQQKLGGFDMHVAKQKAPGVKEITKIRATQGNKPAIISDKKDSFNDNTKLDDLLDINKLLAEVGEGTELSSNNPYDLSFIQSDKDSLPNFSDDDAKPTKKQQLKKEKKLKDPDGDSVIQSDSSLGQTIDQLRKQSASKAIQKNINPVRSAIMNEIKRRLKKLKTQEKFEKEKSLMDETGQSTANAAHTTARPDDKSFNQQADQKKPISLVGEGQEAKKKAFLQVIGDVSHTFLNQQKPRNPYDYIDKKLQKIQINSGMPYLGTSVDEILEIRNQVNEAQELQEENKFLKAGYFIKQNKKSAQDMIDEDDDDPYIKPQNDPYQLKTVYGVSQDEEFNPYSDDEEAIQLELQPFDTATSIGYQHLLTHQPIQFRTRRSDIIVSSTLQITLAPADGDYVPLDQALLTPEQIQAWCAKRHEFRALQVKNASYDYSEKKAVNINAQTLLKQITIRQENIKKEASERFVEDEEKFAAQAQAVRKTNLIPPTLLQKPLKPEVIAQMSEDEKRIYTIQKNKYDGFQRQLKKMEVKPWEIVFSLEDAKLLSEGKYHEEIAEEEAEEELENKPTTVYFGREENFYEQNLKNFEKTYREQFEQQPRFKSQFSAKPYLPKDLQQELNLPNDLEDNKINYYEILKKDCQRKRKTPHWSGQEVLEVGLNEELSNYAVAQINSVRVWPKGFFGYVKKFRVFLKMIIKADWFNNLLMLAVLINTIIMSLASYGITQDFQTKLDKANLFFTWFFICEMIIKLSAIGVKKYIADKMNWLDGGIVSLSVMEMILTAVSGAGGNLSAFKTIRVLRTLRVLRVARLLRGMQSMQVIIAVFVRSASSFMYITMLLFVFLFIYTLLGMQQFGNCLNFVAGKPRDNFDTFLVAFYTSFQVMSSENWNGNVINLMRSPEIPIIVPPLYLISWIFIGNYVLLNLFLAILLDSFLEEDGEEGVDLDELARLAEIKRQECVEKEKIRRLKKLGASTVRKNSQADKNKRRIPLVEALVDDVDDMEHKAIRDIFIDEGLIKKKDPEKVKANMFAGVQAEKALYLFSKQNVVRIYAYKMITHKVFDNLIMLVIALSSAKLAIATYEKYLPPDSPLISISEKFDITLNIIFLFECISKNIALGFIMEEGSYLRESWNQLDFFIVVSSIFDMALQNVDIPAIKILRLLRTLRPLRVISHNRSMKLIVSALFESAGAIANVVVLVVACWLMFGIFGMNLFAGKFYYCNFDGETDYTLLTIYACENAGGEWKPWVENFDNILQAMLVLFCESSSESWPDVMYRAMDASAIDYGPVIESQKLNGGFFILFMLIGNFFLMNFFVGVLFLKYAQASRREKIGYTTEQLAWLDIQRMILGATVPHELQYKPLKSQVLRTFCWSIVNSTKFDLFIMVVIVLNIGQMALYHLTAPLQFIKVLEFTNYIFTAIFILEATLKLITFRLAYFKTGWNKFDFFVCCSSIVDIMMSQLSTTDLAALKAAPQLARILRVLRVTRIIKLAGKNEGLQALLATIQLAIGPIMNVFALLVLVLFIFSVLGNFMLGEINPSYEGMAFYQYKNFANFHLAMQTMFVITTGESWNYYMYDSWTWGPYCTPGWNCGSILSPIYFVAFVMIVQFIMINLFALVVIDQFEMYYMSEDNPIEKFKKTFEVFLQQWISMTMKYRGVKMREKQLFDFFRKLKVPLGVPEETTDNTVKKIVLKMGIRSDGGYIYFNEMLYRCMRRQFGNFKLGKRLQIAELLTQYKVYLLTLKFQNQEKKAKDHELFFDKMIGNGKSVNPFLQQMYYKISFLTWRNYAEKLHKEKIHEEKQLKKKQRLEAQGRTFIPRMFEEEKRKVQHIIIEVEEELLLTSEEETEKENDSLQVNNRLSARKRSTNLSISDRQKMKKERYSMMKERENSSSKIDVSAQRTDQKSSNPKANVYSSSKRSEVSAGKK